MGPSLRAATAVKDLGWNACVSRSFLVFGGGCLEQGTS